MNLISLKCTCCGAIMTVSSDVDEVICEYCNNKLLIDKSAEYIANMHFQETNLKLNHEKYMADMRLKELDLKAKQEEGVRRANTLHTLFLYALWMMGYLVLIPLTYLLCLLFQYILDTRMITENMWLYIIFLGFLEYRFFLLHRAFLHNSRKRIE